MTSRRLSRTALAVVLSAAALVGAGCGDKEDVTTNAATEGIWLDAGRLDYHIQGSRVLEPGLVPDKSYLKGIPAGTTQPTGKEIWFAVFLRIENRTKSNAESAKQFEIVDTQGKTFTPLVLDGNINPFAYEATNLAPDKVLPVPDSVQDLDSFSGSMLLFKIPLSSYQNRPLEFHIHAADGTSPAEASLDLDV